MKIKMTHPSPTDSDVTVFSRRVGCREGEVPLVITSSGTPHPYQPEPKLTRKPG
jgi:hypothetical protein